MVCYNAVVTQGMRFCRQPIFRGAKGDKKMPYSEDHCAPKPAACMRVFSMPEIRRGCTKKVMNNIKRGAKNLKIVIAKAKVKNRKHSRAT